MIILKYSDNTLEDLCLMDTFTMGAFIIPPADDFVCPMDYVNFDIGWEIGIDDLFSGKFSQNNRDEIIAYKRDTGWMGLLTFENGIIKSKHLIHDTIFSTPDSHGGDWSLDSKDNFLIGDLLGNGTDDIFVSESNGEFITS